MSALRTISVYGVAPASLRSVSTATQCAAEIEQLRLHTVLRFGTRASAARFADALGRRYGPHRLAHGSRGPAAQLLAELRGRGFSLATAESCTGGLVAGAITEVSGSSHSYWGGWITYANEAKADLLGVPGSLLASHGAVSEACVRSMADGARRSAGVDVAVAVSGVAGPGGGTSDKPVGTVWFAVSAAGGTVVFSRRLRGGREAVRIGSVVEALVLARSVLAG